MRSKCISKRAKLVECADTAHTLWQAAFSVLLKQHVVRKIQTYIYLQMANTGSGISHRQINVSVFFYFSSSLTWILYIILFIE